MKRYDIEVQIVREEGIETAIVEMVTLSDLQARDLKLAELARALPHGHKCHSKNFCGVSGCGSRPWAFVHEMADFRYLHEFEPGDCNCPLGELLAMLEKTA
jgi:hypothetical protein